MTQSNTNESGDATAVNLNGTAQENDQGQFATGGDATTGDATGGAGGDTSSCGCESHAGDGGDATSGDAYGGDVTQTQDASNSNETTQDASAESKAVQVAPTNVNVSVWILSHGDSGDVSQTNSNESGDATAVNENATWQSNEQGQYGSGGQADSGNATGGDGGSGGDGGDATSGDAYGGDVTQSQTASNENATDQKAEATSEAVQIAPTNANVEVRILSKGDSGDVSQTNSNESGDATAVNKSATWQSNEQSQKGIGGDATSGDATGGDGADACGCKGKAGDGGDATTGKAVGGDVDQSQTASNSNETKQHANAESKAVQVAPTNVNLGVHVLSKGDSGHVSQTNSNESGDATAVNKNATWQSNEQSQKGIGGDATSGDATGGDGGDLKGCAGSCSYEAKRCKPSGHGYGKSRGRCTYESKKRTCGTCEPRFYPCDCFTHAGDGGNATTGKAVGGDVTQYQTASNDNATRQEARAVSKAVQLFAAPIRF
ncbi:MAG TPA: hypothetical protein VNJ53_09015 [Gaiellaceae bacterium]|nr:hypothetical protein [Gaiellaceae bacterium]